MKKLPVLLCIFLLIACAPSEVHSDKFVERNGIKYEINSQIPCSGVSADYYENGQLELKSNHKDGAEHGLSETYKENGQEQDFSPMCYQNGNQVDMSKCK